MLSPTLGTSVTDVLARRSIHQARDDSFSDLPPCDCLEPQYESRRWGALRLHAEHQDTSSDAWKRLLDLIDRADDDGRAEFDPAAALGWGPWRTIVELPRSIAKLKATGCRTRSRGVRTCGTAG